MGSETSFADFQAGDRQRRAGSSWEASRCRVWPNADGWSHVGSHEDGHTKPRTL
jgi:hypothetical protein